MIGKEIIITVSPDGNVNIEAQGYQGRECIKATASFEKDLGIVEKRKFKPVALQEEQEVVTGARNKLRY
ncbi:DUF2997 domain-containing protein [Desulfoscipio geothermicus]|uniref:DUF2997 domain-containing protein n=1 Tax=Desulfoscipio geothermicus DSM 3669 TaxID=1121426 RepID=A0A1I6E435_9FIRM|nr:DUF2997 domain-containing protein [Desulfoscipio geothermicus]SFR12456.1 Protein of unknown function [Desulfoscipio geothermicus DSM 3669]